MMKTPTVRTIAWLLGGLALLSPAGARAQAYTNANGFVYTIVAGAATITGYNGSGGAVSIPGTLAGYQVSAIGNYAFAGCSNLSSIIISNGVGYLDEDAFYNCTNLTSVTLPGSLISIEDYAFAGCSNLTSVTIPAGVKVIGNETFGSCSGLTNVTIPDSVISIGSDAFAFCSGLTNLAIPASVSSIGTQAFSGCARLTAIAVALNNPDYSSSAGVLFNQNQTVLVAYPAGNPASSYLVSNTVTSIGNEAFACCQVLTDVTISAGVKSIGVGAFSFCTNLTGVTIGTNVGSIGIEAFQGCTSLASVVIPDSVTNLLASASPFNQGDTFQGCTSLASATVGNGVTSIGGNCFDGCTDLSSVTIGTNVTVIGSGAFYDCASLADVTIPGSVTNLGDDAFLYCASLAAITVGASNATYSSVDGVLFDKSQTTLFVYPAGKRGSSYTIPNGVNRIGTNAFVACASLARVTIPASVSSIGDWAFFACTNLSRVYFEGNPPPSDYTFGAGGLVIEDGTLFQNDSALTAVYYLPGNTNWIISTFAGIPAVLWNPSIQTTNPSFGVRTNQFGFSITGTAGIPILLETCTNLANPTWTPLLTGSLTNGAIYCGDPAWTNYPRRFYRIRSP